MTSKYDKATLPKSVAEAEGMAEIREGWALMARNNDKDGSAYEFELTALLLREWAFWNRVSNDIRISEDERVKKEILGDV